MAHTHTPEWMGTAEHRAGIYEFEMVCAALGVSAAIMLYPGRPILLCCDNEGANGTPIRGCGKTALGRAIASFIWRIAAETETPIWAEYFKSGHNVADAPS